MSHQNAHVRPVRPSIPLDPNKLNSEELLVVRSVIRQHRYRKFKIDKNVNISIDYDFAILLGRVLSQCYNGEDPAIQKFVDELAELEGGGNQSGEY